MKQKNKLVTPLNVLFLEDNPKDAEVCRELIIDAGYNLDIDITATEKEFESFLLSHKYDIILSDFKLPGFDAFGALRLCSKICPNVPFICVSGQIGEDTAIELLKLGAVDYVLKDRLERLPFAIKRAIDDAKDKESRQKAEMLLAASEVRYRRLFESAKDGILILDAESGKIVDVNPFLIQLLGYSKEEFLEKEIWEIGFFKNIVANKDKFMELQQKKYVRYENLPLETSDGRKINVEFVSNVYSVNSRDVIQCNIRDITERKRAEEALMKSEIEFHTLAESMPQIVWITRADGWNIYFNQKWVDYTGLTLEESSGHGWNKPFHPDDQKYAMDAWQNAIKNNAVYSIEARLRRADGKYNWFLVRGVPLKDNEGTILKWFGTCTDINELKLAVEELREGEERFRIAAENLTDVIYDWDIKENINWYGDIDGITGYQPGGFPRTLEGWEATIHPEDKDRVMAALQNHVKGVAPYAVDYRVRRRDGEWRWWSARGTALRNDRGEPYKMMGSISDITEQKDFQNRIKFNSELLSHIGQSVIATDLQGNVIYWNHGAEEIYGWSSVEAMGQNIVVLTPAEQTKAQAIEIMKALSEGNSWYGEFLVKRKDGSSFPAEVTDAPIIDSDGKLIGIIGISSDITARKRAEEALSESEINFRTLSDSGQALVWTAGTDKLCNYFNKVWLQFTGRSLEQEMGNGWVEGVHPDDMQRCFNIYVSAFDKLEKFSMEYRLRRYDGEYRWILDDGSPRFNSKGEFAGYIGHCLDITERKRAEEELNKFFNLVPVMVCVAHIDGRFIKINDEWEKVLNFTEKEILEMSFLDLIHPDDREATMKEVTKQIEGGSTFNFINRYRCKDRSYKWLEWAASPAEHKTVLYAAARDITDRKRAEQELLKLSRATEQSPASIIITDTEGNIEYINKKVTEISGYRSEEVIGKNPRIFTSGEKTKIEYKTLWDTIASGKEWRGEFHNKKKNGELYWEFASISPILNREGVITNFLAVKEDITQSKKDQAEISRMANVLEATPDLVGMAYPNGDVFYLNRGGRLLMQIPAVEDITKLNIREFHPEEISLLITQKGLPIAKDRGYWSAETRIITRTGEEIPVLQNIISHKNYENVVTHYSTIIRDIREIKKMEENLMDAKEKAEQSDKLKTEFLAQMSHEIRSPMNAVISFATLLKDDLSKDLSPEHLEYFAGIDSAGRRLIRTVELILNASELQVGTYKPDFSDMGLIGEILTRISSEYKLLAEEKGLTFNFRSNIEEAVIEGDKESIYQVFVNLMDNAVKYTQKGSVSINVEKNEDAQEVKVTIEDSGIGISQEFLDQMFEPFTQEDRGYSRRYEGNGLGLSLVKKYCELNGITIQVKSKKGIGTKFELIFSSIE